jgi:hypothetical protein
VDDNQNIPQRTLSEDADMPDYQTEETPLSYPGPDSGSNSLANAKRAREAEEDDDYDD